MAMQHIVVEEKEQYSIITLNRPKANALSLDLLHELEEAVQAADENSHQRALLITGGTGRFFAAGADIPSILASLDDPLAEGTLLAEGIRIFDRIAASATPIIALVNGFALGGGCELALACHMRIAASTAAFGQPEINLGILPGWGGTFRLPQIIGRGRAYEWLLTGRNFSAEEALEAGLVSKVTAPEALLASGCELAETLATKPPVSVQQTLRVLREGAYHPDQGPALECQAFAIAAASQDAKEGVSAFVEKRKPHFTGS